MPTIALILLLVLPFMDLRRERRPSRRPVAMVAAVLTILSMAILTWKGATAKEALASEVIADVPRWVKPEKLPPAAVPGAKLFATAGCTACHTYLGDGLVEPRRARSDRDRHAQPRHQLPDPAPAVPVLREPGLADAEVRLARGQRLHQLAVFLEASKGSASKRAQSRGCTSSSGSRAPRAPRTRPACSRRWRRPTARSASPPRAPASRCSRPSCTATRELSRDETLARLLEHAPNATLYDPNDWKAPYASGLGEGRRVRHLPVLDGNARHDRLRRDAEPHPPRGVGRDQGGAPARPDAARDAALGDPPAQHAHAARGRRDDPLPRAGLLPRRRDGRRPRRLHRRRARSTSSGSSTR